MTGYTDTVEYTAGGAVGAPIADETVTVSVAAAGSAIAPVAAESSTVSVTAGGEFPAGNPNAATGGSIVDSGGYRIHTFAADGTFTPNAAFDVEALVVAGGGGGGGLNHYSGAGGAGGLLHDAALGVTAQGYGITIGAGGVKGPSATQRGLNGSDSVFSSLTSIGGGGGSARTGETSAGSGGSGGGRAFSTGAAGSGTVGQGYAGGGYFGGGGGGASEVGATDATVPYGGVGGDGISYDISGSSLYYAGGGGGGSVDELTAGGLGGGGTGGDRSDAGSNTDATNGTDGLGGGGGGGSLNTEGGDGGDGVVIIRYPIPKTAGIGAVVDYIDLQEITSLGTLYKLLTYLDSLSFEGAGSVDAIPALSYADIASIAGSGVFGVPSTYIFIDMDNLSAVGWNVSKTIQDPLWKLSTPLTGTDVPTPFRHLRVIAPDHNDVDRTVFIGFLPQARTNLSGAGNFTSLSGFDYAWYLTSQYIAEAQRITDEDTDPSVTITAILGGADWAKTTGIEPYNMKTVTDWATIKKSYIFDPNASKWKCIQEICEHTNHIFVVKWVDTGTDFHPVAYFVHEDDIDTELDLPALVTITAPDAEFVSASKESQQVDKINRVVVKGANKITGVWYDSVVESAEVTAGEEIPIEYRYESTDLDTQAKADARATTLYNFYNTDSDTYTINFKQRMDLELYQRIQFSGYADIATGVMRVISIRYGRKAADSDVEVVVAPDQNLSNLRALSRLLGDDFMNTQDRIKEQFFIDLTKIAVGTVQSIDGAEAVVALERDGGLVKGRVLS